MKPFLTILFFAVAIFAASVALDAQPVPFGQVVATHVFDNAGESPDPQFGLLELAHGGFIGITQGSGSNSTANRMIYTMAPTGAVTVMATFANSSGQLGFHLYEGSGTYRPIQASDGNFYGVSNGQLPDLGNIYKLTPSGVYSVVYSFTANAGGASAAQGGLAEGLDGNLYGFGGGNGPGGWGIYKINLTSGAFSWVYYDTTGNFLCVGTPVFGSGNLLYGISEVAPQPAQASVFSYDTGSMTFSTVALLTPDQAYARSFSDPLMVAPDGSIWFTTLQTNYSKPGCPPDCSNIIEVSAGQAQTVYTFPGQPQVNAVVSLTMASDGQLYGDDYNPTSRTAKDSLFQYSTSASSVAYFTAPAGAGTDPSGPLTQDANGMLRGTHAAGASATSSGATILLDLGLPKPLPAIRGFAPASGSAGTMVTVLGSHFVNVSAVTLNGKTVPFKNVASGVVKFSVPAGASTGAIAITTPAGMGVSASAFQVD